MAVLVSSTDWFVGARDEEGHLRLDPNIDFQYFSSILQAIWLPSLQELLTQLPVEHDVIAMIAHLDFLGLIDQGNPTLDDVDATFFCMWFYDIHDRTYSQRIRPSTIRSMAARFTVALAREEYDFSDDRVMDRIYWYVMFILSAHFVFDSRLRDCVYEVSEICFCLFKPSFLEPLKKLRLRVEEEVHEFHLPTGSDDADHYGGLDCLLEKLIDTDALEEFFRSNDLGTISFLNTLWNFHNWYRYRCDEYFFRPIEYTKKDIFLEPLVAGVSQVVFEGLHHTIARRVTHRFILSEGIFHEDRFSLDWRFMNYSDTSTPRPVSLTSMVRETIKREILRDLFESNFVQDVIQYLISAARPALIRKLEHRHAQLVIQIQDYPDPREHVEDYLLLRSFYWDSTHFLRKLMIDEMTHQSILEKLQQESITVKEIQTLVVERLYETALRQITKWGNIQRIKEHGRKFRLESTAKNSSSTSTKTPHHHRVRVVKSLPRKQLKHGQR